MFHDVKTNICMKNMINESHMTDIQIQHQNQHPGNQLYMIDIYNRITVVMKVEKDIITTNSNKFNEVELYYQ